MGYSIDSAEWPAGTEVSAKAKQVVERFYQLLDDPSPQVGDILADEIFTEDGVAYFGGTPSTGTDEIRRSRDNAWKAIATRRHEIIKVYVFGANTNDLLFTARVAMGLRNGKHVEGEFAGRLILNDTGSKVRLYQVWGDTSALVAALKG